MRTDGTNTSVTFALRYLTDARKPKYDIRRLRGRGGLIGQKPMQTCAQIPRHSRIFLMALLLPVVQYLFVSPILAQQVKFHGDRKLVTELKPVYPPLAREMKLTGTVKIVVLVAPDGHVLRTQLVGGNPLLAQAADQAITKAKWQAHSTETKELVEIRFQANDE